MYNTHLHSEEWIENKLLQAKKCYKEKKKDADKLRLKFLEDKAQAIADEGNLELAAIYKQLIQTEQQRLSAQKIKWALEKSSKGGIVLVDIIHNGQRKKVTNKEELEQVCMESIQKNTPKQTIHHV